MQRGNHHLENELDELAKLYFKEFPALDSKIKRSKLSPKKTIKHVNLYYAPSDSAESKTVKISKNRIDKKQMPGSFFLNEIFRHKNNEYSDNLANESKSINRDPKQQYKTQDSEFSTVYHLRGEDCSDNTRPRKQYRNKIKKYKARQEEWNMEFEGTWEMGQDLIAEFLDNQNQLANHDYNNENDVCINQDTNNNLFSFLPAFFESEINTSADPIRLKDEGYITSDSSLYSTEHEYFSNCIPLNYDNHFLLKSKLDESVRKIWNDEEMYSKTEEYQSNNNFIHRGTNLQQSIWSNEFQVNFSTLNTDNEKIKFDIAEDLIIENNCQEQPETEVFQSQEVGDTFNHSESSSFVRVTSNGSKKEINMQKGVKRSINSIASQENLLTSESTHFRPIKNDSFTDGHTFQISYTPKTLNYERSASGSLYLNGINYFEVNEDSQSASDGALMIKFRKKQNEKGSQTYSNKSVDAAYIHDLKNDVYSNNNNNFMKNSFNFDLHDMNSFQIHPLMSSSSDSSGENNNYYNVLDINYNIWSNNTENNNANISTDIWNNNRNSSCKSCSGQINMTSTIHSIIHSTTPQTLKSLPEDYNCNVEAMKAELITEGEELIQSLLNFDINASTFEDEGGTDSHDLYTNGNFYFNLNKIIQELCLNPATKALSSVLDQILYSGNITASTNRIETIIAEADKCPRMSNKKKLFQFKLDSEKRLVRKRLVRRH